MRLTTTKNRLRILLRTLRRLSAAYAGQLREGSRLPPGRLRNLHHMEADNQRAVLECIDRHGPIFKAWQDRSVVICVAGLDRIRRLIAERGKYDAAGFSAFCGTVPDWIDKSHGR